MEHRYTERFNFDIPVLLYQYNHPTALGRIRNATQYGFYIECDSGLFETLQPILVEIHPLDYGEQVVRIHALIIHTQSRGLGVELEALNTRDTLNLKHLLKRFRALMAPAVPKRSKAEVATEELMFEDEPMMAYQVSSSSMEAGRSLNP